MRDNVLAVKNYVLTQREDADVDQLDPGGPDPVPLVLAVPPPAGSALVADPRVRGSDTASYGDHVRHAGVTGGTLLHDAASSLSAPWHLHAMHQIEYTVDGVLEVRTRTDRYVLSPGHASWIPAGLAHRVVIHRATAMSVFLDPALVPEGGDRVRVIPFPELLQEMARHALRWPVERPVSDRVADTWFRAFADLVTEWLGRPDRPTPESRTDSVVQAAMAYTQCHLAAVTLEEVCRAAGASARTVRRRFLAEAGMTWREYLTQQRLDAADTLLAAPGRSVAEVAHAVGFDSPSAFSRAYARRFGRPPTGPRPAPTS